MSNINYLDIIKKAWLTTWRNKYLWWFGFFLALGGSGSFFNYSGKSEDINTDFTTQFSNFISNHATLVITGAIILLVLCTLLFVLSILSRGALIKSIEKNIQDERSSFRTGLREGKKYFWKIFFLSLLISLAIIALALVIIIPIVFLFTAKSYILGTLLAITATLILIPLFILAYFLRTFGFLYLVLGDLSISDAAENAYNLFLANIGASFLMALIFLPLSLVLGFAFLLLFISLAIVFLIIGLILFLLFSKAGAFIALGLAILIAILVLLLLRSIYETFAQAIWIFFFYEIAKPKTTETVTETIPEEIPTPAATPDPVIFLDK